jgi:PncC family amidohydrolase
LESKELVALLREQGRTITTAESLTGGRIAAAITAVPGSSQVFPGGVVSYCDQVKHLLLGVPAEILNRYGAVSEPVAKAMAAGAAKLLGTDLAISATGLAGPDGDGVNPVGTVYLGLWADGNVICKKQVFSGDRAAVQAQAVAAALEMALEYLR